MAPQARYQFLDALRGVAALSVVWQHLAGSWGFGTIVPQCFLAVDFFFILSGFVIAHAYRDRLKASLSPIGFIVIRFIRLHPLLIVGAVIGTIILLMRTNGWPTPDAILAGGALAALGLPAFFTHGTGLGFPINPPAWSLFFELIANVAYAFIARFLTPLRIALLLAIATAILVKMSLDLNAIPGGWQEYGIREGCSRIFYGFTMGLLLYEIKPGWKVAPAVGYLAALVLAACLFFPRDMGMPGHLIIMLLIWPAITWLGSAVSENRFIARAGATIGALSYPLYILHWPLINPLTDAFRFIDPAETFLPLWIVLQVAIVTAVAWFAMVAIDQPVRERLTRWWKAMRTRPAHSETSAT